jgi:hypothetical protein
MANVLKPMVQSQIIQLFEQTKSISKTTRDSGVSRNTVKRVIRKMELTPLEPVSEQHPQPTFKMDFSFLEKLFEQSRREGENLKFETHIKGLAETMAKELMTEFSAVDTLKLETAVLEYMQYRQAYLRAFTAGNANYAGVYAKAHDKVAKAAEKWTMLGSRAFENFCMVIKDLEIKRDRRLMARR